MTQRSLHHSATVVDGHNHIMIELAQRRTRGEHGLLRDYFGPRLRAAGVDVVMLVVGGDGGSLNNGSDLSLWAPLSLMDMVWQEAEEASAITALCLNPQAIDEALRQGKIAILLTMEGGRALEGKPNVDSLAGLRTFHRLGLRELQLVDNPRNRIGDGKGESRTKGGLTHFGVSVVKEMNRLGMLINVSHLTEPGFWDVIEASQDPIVDSHSNCRAVCDHPRNITDEQIRAIASGGGALSD